MKSIRTSIVGLVALIVLAVFAVFFVTHGAGRSASTPIVKDRSADVDKSALASSPSSGTPDERRSIDRTVVDTSTATATSIPTPVREDTAVKLARMRARMVALAAAENWQEEYGALTHEKLEAERVGLERSIYESTKASLEQRFASGQAEFTGEVGAHRANVANPFEIAWLRMEPDGRWQKCALPEDGFEEPYRQRALSVWLQERMNAQQGFVDE